MNKANPAILFGFLATVLGLMGGLALMKGALLVGKHEADTLHLLQIVFRMDAGQWPHLDFMTPIGALAFAPIAFFMGQGVGVGHAILYAQIGLGLVLLPAVWWVGIGRMRGWVPYLFGATVLVLATALVFGLGEPTISISMYYNRWAWAISFVAIGLAILPALGRQHPILDGGIIGVCMAALVLLKMTYFVAFAPAIVIGMLLLKTYKALGVALFLGVAVLAVLTLFSGFEFWQAYLGDLLLVAGSELRAQPGESLRTIILAPAYVTGTVVAVSAMVLLRQTNDRAGGATLLFLIPSFIYVSFQNFGNDAQWLVMLAVLVFSMLPDAAAFGRWNLNLRAGLTVVGVVALTLAAPSMINLATSPYRHLGLNKDWYRPILPQHTVHHDIRFLTLRTHRIETRIPMDDPAVGHLVKDAVRDDLAMLMGVPLPACELEMGLAGWINVIAQDLQQAGLSKGKRLFVADVFSSHWLFNDLEPLPQGAPWYYGGLSGFDAADYLLVPLCPAVPGIRKQVLEEIAARDDISLTEIRRTGLYVLLEIAP
ncbi:hypothetical protein JI58_06795 [Marinosulfonomonas sp. PRT-SC04]|nr:hypothetical protein JI58_06795 [Marinosulfonomonas sp. PRT-SC04]